jgi:acetoin utilization protein AcuB
MYVKNRMTVNPVSIHPDQTISEVLDLMHDHSIHRLPVIERGRLVGLVTEGVVAENTPSNATSLSMHEINYLLSKTKVKDIMIKKVFTISPEALLEEAADIMETRDIGCLPVVGEDSVLLGIITRNDILKAFVELFGYHQKGTRVVIEMKDDKPGVIMELAKVFTDLKINITHFAAHRNGVSEIVLRCDELDKNKVRKLLEEKEYKVVSVL